MIKTVLLGAIAAAGVALAPIAGASPDDLTNLEVAGSGASAPAFTPYKVTVPEPASGGQGPFDHFVAVDPDGAGPLPPVTHLRFDDGLSDSSRDMLDSINEEP